MSTAPRGILGGMFIDTHCHIQSIGANIGEDASRGMWAKLGDRTATDVIQAARDAGVSDMVVIGCTTDDSQLAVDFAAGHDGVYVSIGIHPHEAAQVNGQAELDRFAALAAMPKVVAVGECGLDYFYTHSPKADQIAILKAQIEIALAHDLPMVFHVREAFDDFWPIFDNYQGIRGVLHSFTDTRANLDMAIERGLYIGVNGIATFAKSPEQLAMYAAIPQANLLLETDAPFLTPVPHRGTMNEPAFVTLVAQFMANLQSVSLSELSLATSQNATHLFSITQH